MPLFDLHCDTLTCGPYPPSGTDIGTLDNPGHHLALRKIPAGTKWVQCFAVFVPDGIRGGDAIAFFDHWAASFHRQADACGSRLAACGSVPELEAALGTGKFGALLTVEGGAALAGRLERVQALYETGVRMMTLTWNGENELASGHDTSKGFTAFGREAVAEMERLGMVVDVSHLNDRGMEELLGFAGKPFAASHSNARAVCQHRRNLPDPFLREMIRRECLIGLTYAQPFLSSDGQGGLDDLYRHVCHLLELGAERCIALGSDYDGAGIHPELDSVEKSLGIGVYLAARGIPEKTAEDIMFGNAWRFFRKQMG